MSDSIIKTRFWERVNRIDDDTSCWEWTAGKSHGYGKIRIENRQSILVHRYSYILHYGAIPDGLLVCHKCNNHPCVRPDHLYAGTYKDNYEDMVRAGNAHDLTRLPPEILHKNSARGTRVTIAVLNDQLVLEIYNKLKLGKTCRALSAEYGIGKTTVNDIRSGRSWGWLTRASVSGETDQG